MITVPQQAALALWLLLARAGFTGEREKAA